MGVYMSPTSISQKIKKIMKGNENFFTYSSIIVVGIVIYALSTLKHGIGVTPDSVIYFDCGRSLSEFGGFNSFTGPFHRYAPLYPILLSPLIFAGMSATSGAWLLNGLTFVSILVFTSYIILKYLRMRWMAIAGILLLILSKSIMGVSSMAWTEPLFILLVIGSLFMLTGYLETKNNRLYVFGAVLASLAALTRYIGVTLVITGFLLILFDRNRPWKKRIENSMIFGIISSLPVTMFMIRNLLVTNTLLGERPSSDTTPLEAMERTARYFTNWYIPQIFSEGVYTTVIIIFTTTFILGLIYLLIKSNERRKIAPWVLFTGVYIFYLNLSSILVGFEGIKNRLLSPVFIPSLLILLWIIQQVISKTLTNDNGRLHSSLKRGATYTLMAILILFITSSAGSLSVEIRNKINDGAGGYSRNVWEDSEIIEELESTELRGPVYSNDPWALRYKLDFEEPRLSPRKTFGNSPEETDDLKEFEKELKSNDNVTLIWFTDGVNRDYIYPLDHIESNYNTSTKVSVSDGLVLEIRNK